MSSAYFFGLDIDIFMPQFQYNPEWFEDEEDGNESDDWDLAKYRREKEDEDLVAEELRIANLSLGLNAGDADGSGGGRD